MAEYSHFRTENGCRSEVHLIDRPEEPAVGASEQTASIIAAVVGNAVFDAIGVRLRTVPFTPSRVKALL
jgi:CO/xanthine dehydrogenase Mo-binding subunit